jgi:hypothetical protein
MTASRHVAWDDTEIPAVAARDIAAALSLWLARERPTLVTPQTPACPATIGARIIAMHDHPSTGLSVLLRTRALLDVLSLRRFRHLLKPEHAARLPAVLEAAAAIRFNPRWGMSPLRLAWAAQAADQARAADRIAA